METTSTCSTLCFTIIIPALLLTAFATEGAITDVKDGVLLSPAKVYLQKGQTQRLACPNLGNYGDAVVIAFYRVTSSPDGSTRELLLRYADEVRGGNYSAGPRYQFTPDFRFVIVSVEERDSGTYQCQKVAPVSADNTEDNLEVVVLDKLFPADRGLLRDGRNTTVPTGPEDLTLSCPVQETPTLRARTLYWSEETNDYGDETPIVAMLFSDGESASFKDYTVVAEGDLLVSTAGGWTRKTLWCHVSSATDKFYLHSSKISLEMPEESNSTVIAIIVSLSIFFLVVLVVFVFVYWRRASVKRQSVYVPVSSEMEGPVIDAGVQDKWIHDFNLGPNGKIAKQGKHFNSLKCVAVFNLTDLAALDDSGVHVFARDLVLREHFTKLLQPAENYVAMAAHRNQKRLFLGAKNGTISCLNLDTCKETVLCSLTAGNGKTEERLGSPDSGDTVHPVGLTHNLTDITVDENGSIFVGDEATCSVTAFYSEGVFMRKYPFQFPPRVLAARSAGEFFVHSGEGNMPITRITTVGPKALERVFANRQRILNPVNLIVDNSSVFVVSDTRCSGQTEILQYDNQGNYLRQFAKAWRGIRGLRTFQSGERLAIYDRNVVRIYKRT